MGEIYVLVGNSIQWLLSCSNNNIREKIYYNVYIRIILFQNIKDDLFNIFVNSFPNQHCKIFI